MHQYADEVVDRFWSQVDHNPEAAGCWTWTGPERADGYGVVNLGRRLELAHRLALFLSGVEIPPGSVAMQICQNRQKRRLAEAKFPVLKTLDQYDFSLMPQLNRSLILELAQGRYLAQHESILLAGDIGTGKTHIATALGVAACQQSYRVRFFTAAGLTNELLEAQAAHRLTRLEASVLRLDLLILDEVGFVPFTKDGADLLFSCLAALHEQVSLIVTTTVPFAQWAELLGGDQRLAADLLDRLTFHAHVLQFSGSSFRLRHSLTHQEEDRRHQ
jgi:DNA replication protein DnaC